MASFFDYLLKINASPIETDEVFRKEKAGRDGTGMEQGGDREEMEDEVEREVLMARMRDLGYF
jgi:hypothetical protein